MTPSADLVGLADCPFCGGEAEFERLGSPRYSTIVACTQCGCRLESPDEFNHGASWNTRTELRALAGAEVGGWLPIKSAPKDFSLILLTNGKVVQSGRYHKDNRDGAGFVFSEAWLTNHGITHWQPLPPPPGSGRGGVENG